MPQTEGEQKKSTKGINRLKISRVKILEGNRVGQPLETAKKVNFRLKDNHLRALQRCYCLLSSSRLVKRWEKKPFAEPHLKKVGLYRGKSRLFVCDKVCAHRTCVLTIKLYFHQNNTPISFLCMPHRSAIYSSQNYKSNKKFASLPPAPPENSSFHEGLNKIPFENTWWLSSAEELSNKKICVGAYRAKNLCSFENQKYIGCSNYSGVNNRSDREEKIRRKIMKN